MTQSTSFYISHHMDTEERIYSDFFWQIHIPNDGLWLICEESNIVQPACFSLWDHEQLLAHNYVVIHCYLEEETHTDSEDFFFLRISVHCIVASIQKCELLEETLF